MSRWHSIDIVDIANMISSLFDFEQIKGFQLAEPLSDFLNREVQGVDSEKLPRETFSRCLGTVGK